MYNMIVFLIIALFSLGQVATTHGSYASVLAEQLNQYCATRNGGGVMEPQCACNLTAVKEVVIQTLKELNVTMTNAGELPTDCTKVSRGSAKIRNESGGVFDVYPNAYENGVEVFCDISQGGWTVFQRRMDGTVNFTRGWTEYVTGFGKPDKEYWMGLEKLHRLTSEGNFELRVDLEDFEGNKTYAEYSTFSVGDAASKYVLNVGGYSGNAGDSLARHDGFKFSTFDQDNDDMSSAHCADAYNGAWWFYRCHVSHLNGVYHKQGSHTTAGYYKGLVWYDWKGWNYSLKFSEMKFRPKPE